MFYDVSELIIIVRSNRFSYTLRVECRNRSATATYEDWSIVLLWGSSHLRFVINSGWSTSGWQFNIKDDPIGLVCLGCVGLMISDGALGETSEKKKEEEK